MPRQLALSKRRDDEVGTRKCYWVSGPNEESLRRWGLEGVDEGGDPGEDGGPD